MSTNTYQDAIKALRALRGEDGPSGGSLAAIPLGTRVRLTKGLWEGRTGRVVSSLSMKSLDNGDVATEYTVETEDTGVHLPGLSDEYLEVVGGVSLGEVSGKIEFDTEKLNETIARLRGLVLQGDEDTEQDAPSEPEPDPKAVKRQRKLEKHILRALRVAGIDGMEVFVRNEDDKQGHWESPGVEWFAKQFAAFMDLTR